MQELDLLIQQRESGKCNDKKDYNRFIEIVFKYKQYFGIQYLSEDNLSEFILYIYPRLTNIFSLYNKEKGSFGTFSRTLIRVNFNTWYKMFLKRKLLNEAIIQYAIEESEYRIAEEQPDYEQNLQEVISEPKKDTSYLFSKYKCRKIPTQIKIMLLALKSVQCLTPHHIDDIVKLTGYSEIDVAHMLQKAKDSIDDKVVQKRRQIEYQNYSYIMKKRSFIQLENMNKKNYNYEETKKAYNYHTSLWRKKLNSMHKIISPSNTTIAEILNLNVTQVNSLVHKLISGDRNFSKKKLDCENENICSHGKPS